MGAAAAADAAASAAAAADAAAADAAAAATIKCRADAAVYDSLPTNASYDAKDAIAAAAAAAAAAATTTNERQLRPLLNPFA